MINIVTCLSFYDNKDLYRSLALSVNSSCKCFANQIEVYTRYIKVVLLVAGTWTEKKMYHGGSFLKLVDDNMDIQNPEDQNRELSGF